MKGEYDHDEVRCAEMAEQDAELLMVGEPRTCCVCEGHNCEVARAERAKHSAIEVAKHCPQCGFAISLTEYLAIVIDLPCPTCKAHKLSEFISHRKWIDGQVELARSIEGLRNHD